MCYEVHEQKLVYRLLVETGAKSKNLKAVAECLDEIAEYIKATGV